MTSISRSRWAAVGAAVAVALGAGGIGITHATTDSGDGTVAAYIPVEPCRLADTRPGGIAADSFQDFDGWGSTGGCNLPNGTSGLSLNVTAVDATQQTNLRFYPQSTDIPDTANLNPSPGAPATPNAVNVSLNDANGKFSVYNRFGNVSVIIDVMGYYDDHTHDSRYYTEEEADAVHDLKADATDLAAGVALGPTGVVSFGTPSTPQTVGELALPAGNYIVNAALVANNNDDTLRRVGCELRLDTTVIGDMSDVQLFPIGNSSTSGERESIALTGGGTLAADATANVVCQTDANTGNYLGLMITAIKVATLNGS